VLKTQTQSALRGDLPAGQALQEIEHTVDRATELANQMLALAKVEQLRQQPQNSVIDWGSILRAVALDVAPLIADKELDFSLDAPQSSIPVLAHEWMLRELVRNLLHNAIKHSPVGGTLQLALALHTDSTCELLLSDQGPGIDEALRQRLFQPFSAGQLHGGSGLGLAICAEIVRSLRGTIELNNLNENNAISGLQVHVRLPLAADASAA
jgi:two-component system, OmpR family, sensor histidine kinase TctE